MALFSNFAFGMKSRTKLTALTLATAVLVSACGDSGVKSTASAGTSAFEVAGDHAIGNPDAKVTLVEYASVVCGHCASWHEGVYPEFKKNYIDTGKVRYVFREFPTAPETLARTGFLIANCADETKFFDNISLQFKQQKQVFQAARDGKAREIYTNIAKSAGLSEAEFEACLSNQEEIDRYEAVVQGGIDAGVTGTPAFFLNGEKMTRTPSGATFYDLASIEEIILPILGEAVPAKADTSAPDAVEP